MADLLVAVMQDAARSVVRKQVPQVQQSGEGQQAQQVQSGRQVLEQPADQQQAQQLLRLADGQQQEQQAAQGAQAQQAQQAQQQADQQQQLAPVPEPMFPGNWESPDPTCRLGVSWAGCLARRSDDGECCLVPQAQGVVLWPRLLHTS